MSSLKSAVDQANAEAGRRLRMLRMFTGKSRKSLAEALGVSPAQIEDFENGAAGIGAHLLSHLSAEMNVPTSFFLESALFEPAPEAAGLRGKRAGAR